MKKINYLKNKLINTNSILRIITTWITNSIIYKVFFTQVDSLPIYIILLNFISIFVILSFISIIINKENFDYYLLMILSIMLSNIWVYNNENTYYILLLFLLIFLLYKYKLKDTKFKNNLKLSSKLIISFSLLSFIVIITIGILRYLTFKAPNFDLGIPSQMFYYMKKTGLPLTTCERDILLSHFTVHFSPIYYLALPLYFLFSSPITLQIYSGLLIVSGVIPIYLLCKKRKLPKIVTIIICFIYSMYAPAICSTFNDFHETMFLLPLFLWLFYWYEKNNNILFTVFAILIAITKEDAPIYLMVFSIYMLFDNNKKKGFITLLLSIIYFIIVVTLINKYGESVMTDRYSNLILNSTDTEMIAIFKTIITSPEYFIEQLVTSNNSEKIYYYLKIFLPFGFFIFNTKKYKNYILLIPIIYITMTTYKYSYNIDFQYNYPIYSFLFYLFIQNVSENKNYNYLFMCIVGTILTFNAYVLPSFINNVSDYNIYKYEYENINSLLNSIPHDASVTADTFFVPHLSTRNEIYETEYHDFNYLTDYIITEKDINTFLEEEAKNYTVINELKNIVVYKKIKET